jgi:hypothetical protein
MAVSQSMSKHQLSHSNASASSIAELEVTNISNTENMITFLRYSAHLAVPCILRSEVIMTVTIKNIFLRYDVMPYGRNLPDLQRTLLSHFPGIEERDISWEFQIKMHATRCFI